LPDTEIGTEQRVNSPDRTRIQDTSVSRDAWTQYWKTGHFESLPEDRAAGRLASLDSAWTGFFSGFSAGARLLDLATGGGDVIRRAIAAGREFKITGVDFADLAAVSASLQSPSVKLAGNTNVSNLPFADASFDGVTSQFGIEYADIAAAAREAIRVLVPGGRGHFVLHHAQSAITLGVSNSLAAYRSVFSDGSAFQSGRKFFQLYQRSAPRAAVLEAEAEFQGVVGVLQSRLRAGVLKSGLRAEAFGAAGNVVALLTNLARGDRSHLAEDALRQIDDAEEQIQASTLRKLEQINAALDRTAIDHLAECLTRAGAVVDPPQELKYPLGKIMAWRILFYR